MKQYLKRDAYYKRIERGRKQDRTGERGDRNWFVGIHLKVRIRLG